MSIPSCRVENLKTEERVAGNLQSLTESRDERGDEREIKSVARPEGKRQDKEGIMSGSYCSDLHRSGVGEIKQETIQEMSSKKERDREGERKEEERE